MDLWRWYKDLDPSNRCLGLDQHVKKTMDRRVIVLDIDGVLLDLNVAVVGFVRDRYGKEITAAHITAWDWSYCLGFPVEDFIPFWDHVWNTPATVFPGAVEFVSTLRNRGFFVIGLSARSSSFTTITGGGRSARMAATRDFPQLGLDDWILVESGKDKATEINSRWLEVELVVEDNPNNARDIYLGTRTKVLLMDRPYNEDCVTVLDAWKRVRSYEEILDHLRER
jgi:uncharacterized HAD superfamily protein